MPSRRVQQILLLFGLVWGLGMIVPDVARVVWPLGTYGMTVDNDGLVVAVDEGGAAQTTDLQRLDRPLQPGDHIELDGAPCRHPARPACGDLLAIFGGMGGLTYVLPGSTVTLPVAPAFNRNVPSTRVTLTAQPDTPSLTDRVVLLCDEVAGVLVIVEAFRLAWGRPSHMTVGFFLFAIWFNPGSYFTFYALLQKLPFALLAQEIMQALAQGAGYGGFVLFALRFPHNRTEDRFRALERAVIPLGLLLAALQLLSFLNVFGWHTEILTRCAILGGYAAAFLAIAICLVRRKYQTPPDFQRMKWVLWGCAFGIPFFIFADSNEATTLWMRYLYDPYLDGWQPPQWVLGLCYLLNGLLAWGVCVAVRRHRVFDVSYRLRQFAGLVVLLSVTGLVEESVKAALSEPLAHLQLPSAVQWLVRSASLLIAVFIGDRVSHAAGHLWNRRYFHAAALLTAAGEKIRDGASLGQMEDILVREPVHHLRLSSAALFRSRPTGFERTGPDIGWEGATKTQAREPDDAALIDTLKHTDLADLRTLKWHAKGLPGGDRAPSLAVAIRDNLLFGFALYGSHDTGDEIDPAEQKLLRQLANDAAHGYLVAEFQRLQAAGLAT